MQKNQNKRKATFHAHPRLSFTRFKIHFIYGFKTEVENLDAWIKYFENEPRKFDDHSWGNPYRFIGGVNEELHLKSPEALYKDCTLKGPEYWKEIGSGEHELGNIKVTSTVTLRKDLFGSMRLTFDVPDRPASTGDGCRRVNEYSVKDILAVMLLAPRTNDKISGKATIPKVLSSLTEPFDMSEFMGNYNGYFSHLFLCHAEAMRNLESTIDRKLKLKRNNKDYSKLKLKWNKEDDIEELPEERENELVDNQVPYIFVEAELPWSLYQAAFLEEWDDQNSKRQARGKYSSDIGAILGRWLTDDCVPFVSADFWERMGIMTDGVFRNCYMSSLVFTVFFGLVTLSLKPYIDCQAEMNRIANIYNPEAFKSPMKPTRDSILRCLELSRIRWHHVVILNRKLDQIITNIIRGEARDYLVDFKIKLMKLRSDAAIHFQDPLTYMWDASVGSELSKYLHTSIIEKLEDETLKKLDILDKLLKDKWETVDMKLLIRNLKNED